MIFHHSPKSYSGEREHKLADIPVLVQLYY